MLLIIRQHRSKLMPPLPHQIYINGQLVGMMQRDEIHVEMPEGVFDIRIQSMLRWFSSTQRVQIQRGVTNVLSFGDREKVWDALFIVDIALWFADLFFTLPAPWDLVYKIFTNGYFVLWILYEFLIRKQYFRTEFHHEIPNRH